jgi:putative peptide zinc metalloprotease protein
MSTPTNSSDISAVDHRVEEATRACLKLRHDLVFTPADEAGQSCYTIEDPIRGHFFRIGIREYRFISLLDGKTSIHQAIAKISNVDREGLDEHEAIAVCDWLVNAQLASTPWSNGGERFAQMHAQTQAKKRLARFNPLCTRIPLARPDRFLAAIQSYVGWMAAPWSVVLTGMLLLAALIIVIPEFDRFVSTAHNVFMPHRWWMLIAMWAGLKIIHELAHAVACRRYGGQVAGAGIILVLLAPLAYVDLTSAWRIKNKWARIHIGAAGMQIELTIAAIAMIAWSQMQPGLASDLMHHAVLLAGVTTIAFNLNPLMRFDGYYMLSDWVEIPNLASDGQGYMTYLGKRYALDERATTPLRMTLRDCFVKCYGAAALVWRILVCISLVIAAAMMLKGLGILLSILATVLWLVIPVVQLIKYVGRDDGQRRNRQWRLLASGLLCSGTIALAVFHVGFPGNNVIPAIVHDESLQSARAIFPGFVAEIYVVPGQVVRKGDPIARLENFELVADLADLELALEKSILKSRVFQQSEEIHSHQAEVDQYRSLEEKRQEKQKQVEELVIRSPRDGRVIARQLDAHLGLYLKTGDSLVMIGDASEPELKIAIPPQYYEHFSQSLGQTVEVRLPGGVRSSARLDRVDPRATVEAPHESMLANNGGDLPSLAATEEEPNHLLTPIFVATARFVDSDASPAISGQRATVIVPGGGETIAESIGRSMRQIRQEYAWSRY